MQVIHTVWKMIVQSFGNNWFYVEEEDRLQKRTYNKDSNEDHAVLKKKCARLP